MFGYRRDPYPRVFPYVRTRMLTNMTLPHV